MKPKHFCSRSQFEVFILNCAIRDRMTFNDAMTPDSWRWIPVDEKEMRRKNIDETSAEIAVMVKKRNRLLEQMKRESGES